MLYIQVTQWGESCFVGPFDDAGKAADHITFATARDKLGAYVLVTADKVDPEHPVFTPQEDKAQLSSA